MFRTSRLPAPRPFGPPRCSPAWSRVQNQPPARPTPFRATTLLASVEPCSQPAVCPPRPFGPPRCSPAWSRVHNQPSARPTPFRATALLASVEPCSKPAACPPRPFGPPRCSPAWSHVQNQPPARHTLSGHHAARQRGAVFKTSRLPATPFRATTLLASVEPCSKPAACPRFSRNPATAFSILNTAPRWRAAWWRRQAISSWPSLVLNTAPRWRATWWRRQPISSRASLVLNTAPRWQAVWWRRGRSPSKVAADCTLRVSECLGLPPVLAETGTFFRPPLPCGPAGLACGPRPASLSRNGCAVGRGPVGR